MSDRSVTPKNFHFFDKISEEVELLSSRGSLLKNKKKSVTFIDEPIALNEKKKRRSLKTKISNT